MNEKTKTSFIFENSSRNENREGWYKLNNTNFLVIGIIF